MQGGFRLRSPKRLETLGKSNRALQFFDINGGLIKGLSNPNQGITSPRNWRAVDRPSKENGCTNRITMLRIHNPKCVLGR